jgi:hypothetical protein
VAGTIRCIEKINPMTSLRTEPAIFRLLQHCLKQLCYLAPRGIELGLALNSGSLVVVYLGSMFVRRGR